MLISLFGKNPQSIYRKGIYTTQYTTQDEVSYVYYMCSYPILFCHLWKGRWVDFIRWDEVERTIISMVSLTHIHYTGMIHVYIMYIVLGIENTHNKNVFNEAS